MLGKSYDYKLDNWTVLFILAVLTFHDTLLYTCTHTATEVHG